MSTSRILDVKNLVVEFPTKSGPFRAVDDVSFSVEQGKTLGIVGESGCGKSTIARSIVRLLKPTAGTISLDGRDLVPLTERQLRPMRSRIQMVFQDPYGSLDPRMTAEDLVAEPIAMRKRGLSRADRRVRARDYLDRVGLPTTAGPRRAHEFSGGQRQRIGIARALACEPDLIVLDEATSALDVSVQAQILQLLRDLQNETQSTFIVISHNLGVVREISQSVVVMSKGRIVEKGSTQRVLESPVDPYTRTLRAAALDPTTMVGIKPREVLSMFRQVSTPTDVVRMTADE
ncbi:ABC transporter ATP-binding protein [Microbacterium sp. MPKO10]|uniref:ABC transporter ATP-binding protein n=1 Tax=Microbacterium sp. MPKO10 TaxID=2989818 RepID=UPI0022363370|nr:dipeptide/oligopeptide/nickel ABC transporter ATP-binding protein [Microbacterium sp. MPKO10]MCW4456932.1 dipeptide/oligopeptide/nickel ABC transporter ATP-binding protein [Microbacterium sp. MPKO10]